jgi:hypothetical protein
MLNRIIQKIEKSVSLPCAFNISALSEFDQILNSLISPTYTFKNTIIAFVCILPSRYTTYYKNSLSVHSYKRKNLEELFVKIQLLNIYLSWYFFTQNCDRFCSAKLTLSKTLRSFFRTLAIFLSCLYID